MKCYTATWMDLEMIILSKTKEGDSGSLGAWRAAVHGAEKSRT